MTFKDKIDKILETNKLGVSSINGIEKKLGIGTGSISKYYKDNEEPGLATVKKIKEGLRINSAWWDKGDGNIFQSEEKTSEQIGDRVPEEVYKNLIEANTEYKLVPTAILNKDYRIILKSEIDSREKYLEKILDLADKNIESKDRLIEQLKKEIEELRNMLRSVHAQKA